MATRPVRDATAPETPRDPRAAAVALSGLTRLFGLVPAVVRVDLRVERGERILMRGANGAGKTTLLRLVATALRPTYGGGRVLGQDLVEGRREIRSRTELLGHRTRLYDDLTAVENLRFTCRLHGLPAAGVEAALATVGLAPVGDERVGGYSQGMRQRVAVARLLLREPDLLLLDEPYAGLDAETRIVLDAELEAAAVRGATVVVATHDPAPGFAPDRVLTMDAGRLRGEAA